MVTGMIVTRREPLMAALPDFGRYRGADGKAIASHRPGRVSRSTGATSDPDAAGGQHETSGSDARTGKAWNKVKRWFGDGVHLIAATRYDIPVARPLTPASQAEPPALRAMIQERCAETPALAPRCGDFRAYRGLDSAETKARLWDEDAIRPLIDSRERWREEQQAPADEPSKPITPPLFPERVDTLVPTAKGRQPTLAARL